MFEALGLSLVLLVGMCVVVGSRGHKLPFEAPERGSSGREYW